MAGESSAVGTCKCGTNRMAGGSSVVPFLDHNTPTLFFKIGFSFSCDHTCVAYIWRRRRKMVKKHFFFVKRWLRIHFLV